jgi:hypothetical protein
MVSIADTRNLSPKSAAMLAAAGIHTLAQLRASQVANKVFNETDS